MFKTMTSVLDTRKKVSEEEIEKIPSYIFCRWLSGNPHTILAANQINYYHNIPIKNQYDIIKTAFAGKIKYIPYPKGESEEKETNLVYIQKHFNLSTEKSKEYLEFISEDELEDIINMYKKNEGKQ